MSQVPSPGWKHVGGTSNAAMYAIANDVLAVVPHENCKDTETTARESLAFQDRHWQAAGARGATVIFMDNVLVQEGGARAVYASDSLETFTTCFALVGETFFGHAVSAVFEGLAKPAIPTRVFRSLEEAMPWIAEMNSARGGPVQKAR